MELIASPHFTTSLYDLTEETTCDYSARDTFIIYVCTEGEAELTTDTGCTLRIARGETVLVPACMRMVRIVPRGHVILLESWC